MRTEEDISVPYVSEREWNGCVFPRRRLRRALACVLVHIRNPYIPFLRHKVGEDPVTVFEC